MPLRASLPVSTPMRNTHSGCATVPLDEVDVHQATAPIHEDANASVFQLRGTEAGELGKLNRPSKTSTEEIAMIPFYSNASAPSDPQRARSDLAHGGSSRAMVRSAVRSPSSRVGW